VGKGKQRTNIQKKEINKEITDRRKLRGAKGRSGKGSRKLPHAYKGETVQRAKLTRVVSRISPAGPSDCKGTDPLIKKEATDGTEGRGKWGFFGELTLFIGANPQQQCRVGGKD